MNTECKQRRGPGLWARRLGAAAVAVTLVSGGVSGGTAVSARAAFIDPLDSAATSLPTPEQGAILGLGQAGKRLVGVGLRGLVIVSDDGGGHWRQADVPVQSDLTAVFFLNADIGWAVGHDGVILTSRDGGLRWSKVLDGRGAQRLFEDHYQERIAHGRKDLEPYLEQLRANFQAGPSLPYLDVYFDTPSFGLAVGPFGMIAATEDGGKTWQPWLENVDNPDFFGFNAIRRVGGAVYMVGERGMVFRLDRAAGRFVAESTGYQGSLFGIVGNDRGDVVTFGLRGTLIRRNDGGQWATVSSPATTTISGGALLADDGFLLVNIAGQALLSRDGGRSFTVVERPGLSGATDVIPAGPGAVVMASIMGVAAKPVGEPAATDASQRKGTGK